jgi:ribose transport system ATP-binding protein
MTSVSSAGLVSNARSTAAATEAARAAAVDISRLRTRAQNLSGGNQQKLMMARWFHRPPLVLLADEPYRGIDIGAKSQITDALRRMAEDGRAVIVVSSELEDVTTIADRILVLAHGSLVGELKSSDRSASVEDILELAFNVGEKA